MNQDSSKITLWLSDLGLNISSFEDDFSNGYLLGTVLYRYNFLDDFGQFANKQSFSISNISKVQLSLEKFSIKFDPHRIINKEPGYALKLLEKIHKALHTVTNTSTINHKAHTLSETPYLSKQERLSFRLKKFEEFRAAQAQLAFEKEKNANERIFQSKLTERAQRLEILKSNQSFMQTWQDEGHKNWRKNQEKRIQRVLHEKKVKLKLFTDKKNAAHKFKESQIADVSEGISEFEKNLIRLGIDHSGESEKKIVKQDLAIEAAVTMAKIKENKKKNIEAAKEREIRQRNLFIEQQKNGKFQAYKEGSLRIGTLLAQIFSNQAHIGLDSLIVYQKKMKKVEDVQRKILEYKKVSEEKWGNLSKKFREELDLLDFTAKKEQSLRKKKITDGMIEDLRISHKNHEALCKPIIKDIFIIAEQAYDYILTNKKIPGSLWNSWMGIFVNKNQFEVQQAHTPSQKKPEAEVIDNEMIKDEVLLYLSGKESWGPLPNNYYLGDILENIIDNAFPLSPPPPIPEGPNYLQFKILILGPGFSGKKTQSKKLSETFGLKIFEMQKIVEDAKKVVQRKSEPEDLKKKKIVDEESEIFTQACLENSTEDEIGKSKLFRAKIRGIFGDFPKAEQEEQKKQLKKDEVKTQGYILLNFPNTLQEAVDLERQLSGFVHPSELPPEARTLKKQENMILVTGTPDKPVPVTYFRSAWDIVIWLNFDEDAAIKRAADRRIDPQGNVYNLSVNPPSDNILAKCKTLDTPTEEQIKNDYFKFNEQKPKLMHWFSLFGLNTTNFFIIDADQSPDAVNEAIKNKIQELASIKNSFSQELNEQSPLTSEIAKSLYNEWEIFKESYTHQITKGLYDKKKLWKKIENSLENILKDFKDLLIQDDKKKTLALSFLEEFISIIHEKKTLSKTDTEEIEYKIEVLSDTLWDIVNQRKQNSVEQRQKIIENYDIQENLTKTAEIALFLCQAELYKYSFSINLIKKYKNIVENSDFSTNPLSLTIEVTKPTEDFLELLLLKFSNSTDSFSFLKEEQKLYLFRIQKIVSWAQESLNSYKSKVEKVFETLDSWIIKSVQLENEAIKGFVFSLRNLLITRNFVSLEFPSNSSILSLNI